ncbi:hypothetical protein [Brevundimonas sp.]|uniref:hypothetical protein n=1 Tax=Brevundimonas sp. TaxID=1871086 RepID=UPI002737F4E2|nr:hypothetical protein [Brevundimonas sp.]MDP3800609.1 hypothetical protein [Brevundimonas sp.]
MRFATALILSISLIASGCATTGGAPPTAMQRAQGQCLAAGAISILAGAIIGNNSGSGDARRGAQRGALVGAGICAVLLAMASAEDQRRIREAEYAALETGQAREETYDGPDGKRRIIRVVPTAAPDRTWTFAPAAADQATPVAAQETLTDICRYKQTTLTVETVGSGDLPQVLVCRNPQTRAWEVQRG